MATVNLTDEELATVKEALDYLRQNQEAFWSTWAIQKERPSELRSRIDAALQALDRQQVQYVPLPNGEYLDSEWDYMQRLEVHGDTLSVYVGGTEVARFDMGSVRLCDVQGTPAQEVGQPDWQPVGYGDIFDPATAKPLRPDYETICEKWREFNSESSNTEDGYEYAICRQRPAPGASGEVSNDKGA